MDRVARLLQASSTVRRQIWASLPYGVRVATVIARLASSTTTAFGKVIYGEFLTRGVTKMPDIHGKPAASFDTSRKPVANRLPTGYGADFGEKVYRILMRKLHRPMFVEDVMSGFLVRFLASGSQHLDEGTTVGEAEQYVIRACLNEAIDIGRKHVEVSDAYEEDGQVLHREVAVLDEDTVERQINRLLPKIRSQLRAIHPDAELYLKLAIVEGYTDREILGDPERGILSKLPHPLNVRGSPLTEKSWSVTYKPKIYHLLKAHLVADLRDAA